MGMSGNRKRAWRALLIVALGSPLAGCQYVVELKVSGVTDHIVIDIPAARRGWLSGKVSIDGMDVWDRAGTVGQGPAWAIIREQNICANHGEVRITYGLRPAGFREVGPARPLVEGKAYGIGVSGCGLTGGATFKILGGRIAQVPRD